MSGPPSKPNRITIALHMTDHDVVMYVAEHFVRNPTPRLRRQPHHKDSWYLQVTGKKAHALMLALRPYMGERRRAQIDKALASYNSEFGKKVTFKQALAIRARFRAGESVHALAAEYGITHWYVYAIHQERPGTFGKPANKTMRNARVAQR